MDKEECRRRMLAIGMQMQYVKNLPEEEKEKQFYKLSVRKQELKKMMANIIEEEQRMGGKTRC